MSGMEGLGRVFNGFMSGSGNAVNMSGCSAVAVWVLASGASSIAVTAAKTYAGSYDNFVTTTGFGQPSRWYQATAADGTAGWTKQASSWSTNTLTLAGTTGYMSVVHFFGTQMADGYKYLKVTATNASAVFIEPYDLTVMRTPANLALLGA